MRYLLIVMATVTLLCSAIVPLAAGAEFAPHWAIGPQLGVFQSKDADSSRMQVGAVLRLRFLNILGVEASANYRREDYLDGVVSTRSWPLLITGMVYPFPIVFGEVGLGWYHTNVDYNPELESPPLDSEKLNDLGWHFGAGIDYPLTPRLRLTGDVRYVFLNYDIDKIPETSLDNNYYIVSVGLLFNLSRGD